MTALPHLTPTEQRLFRMLTLAGGELVSLNSLLRAGWGSEMEMDETTPHLIHVNIQRLRKKLAASDWRIENHVGVGYRLVRVERAA